MLKSEKKAVIKELNEKFARAKTAIVAEFTKVDVETVTKLRKKFRDSRVEYKVLKNTLAARSEGHAAREVIAEDFDGPGGAVPSATTTWWPRPRSLASSSRTWRRSRSRRPSSTARRSTRRACKALAKLPGLPSCARRCSA